MHSSELRHSIEQQCGDEHVFIRWQDVHSGETRVELIEYFLRVLVEREELSTFELLDMEQLWQGLVTLYPDALTRVWRKKVEVIDWQFTAADGRVLLRSCCFRPEGLLAVYEELHAAPQLQNRGCDVF